MVRLLYWPSFLACVRSRLSPELRTQVSPQNEENGLLSPFLLSAHLKTSEKAPVPPPDGFT